GGVFLALGSGSGSVVRRRRAARRRAGRSVDGRIAVHGRAGLIGGRSGRTASHGLQGNRTVKKGRENEKGKTTENVHGRPPSCGGEPRREPVFILIRWPVEGD